MTVTFESCNGGWRATADLPVHGHGPTREKAAEDLFLNMAARIKHLSIAGRPLHEIVTVSDCNAQ